MVENLIARLEAQLEALKNPTPGYKVREFEVWHTYGTEFLGEAVVRVEERTHDWGYCNSETCQHMSHDPYTEGDTMYVTCTPVGLDEEGRELFRTPDGVVFGYDTSDRGQHYCPRALLFEVEPS